LAAVAVNTNTYLRLVGATIAVIVGVIAALTQMEKPLLGLGLLVATAIAFPVEFQAPGGVMMSSSLPLSGVLCALWLLHVVLTKSPIDRSRVVYASLGFAATGLVSFAVGQFPWF